MSGRERGCQASWGGRTGTDRVSQWDSCHWVSCVNGKCFSDSSHMIEVRGNRNSPVKREEPRSFRILRGRKKEEHVLLSEKVVRGWGQGRNSLSYSGTASPPGSARLTVAAGTWSSLANVCGAVSASSSSFVLFSGKHRPTDLDQCTSTGRLSGAWSTRRN